LGVEAVVAGFARQGGRRCFIVNVVEQGEKNFTLKSGLSGHDKPPPFHSKIRGAGIEFAKEKRIFSETLPTP
jgi:hypothetical protein